MGAKKHHYVPRFYLKGFASRPKRINLHNLDTGLSIQNASLKDQCYRARFYGATDHTENRLAKIENKIAPILRAILDNKVLPTETDRKAWLFAFVALQLLRTTSAANRIDSFTDKAMKQAYCGDPRLAGIDLESLQIVHADSVLTSLDVFPHLMFALSHLALRLMRIPTKVSTRSDGRYPVIPVKVSTLPERNGAGG